MIARILNGKRGLRCRVIFDVNEKHIGVDFRVFVDRQYLVVEVPDKLLFIKGELSTYKADLLAAAQTEHPGVRKLWTVCPN